jgi:ATP-dependent exoDNAse (exonuclease V) alpha subunit
MSDARQQFCHTHTKKTFPLVLAYALTVHKSQGMSIDHTTIVHFKNVFAFGMAYVALSRPTSRQHLKIVGGLKESDCLPIPPNFR